MLDSQILVIGAMVLGPECVAVIAAAAGVLTTTSARTGGLSGVFISATG